jgi:hypothetical protein
MGHHRGVLASATGRGGDQPLFQGQEFRSRPAALLQRPLGHHRHRPFGKEPVGELLELGAAGAGQLTTHRCYHVLTGERGRLGGQPVRTGQPVKHRSHRPLGQLLAAVACPAGHLPDHAVRVVAALGRLPTPAVIQGVRGRVLLGLAGGLHRPLDQPRRPLPSVRLEPLDLQVDLVGPLGEQPDELLGQALELAVAVPVGRRPPHTQGPDKLPLVAGAVDGVRCQPMPVQVAAVQRRPAPVRALDAVGHHQVGVQQRVTLPGRPMVEPDRQQPLSGHVLDTAVAAPGSEVSVQVGDRLADTGVVSAQHRPSGGRVAEPVRIETLLVGRSTTSNAGTALRPCGRPRSSRVSGWWPSNIRWKPAGDASPCSPRLVAPAPYHRPGDSPWPDRYASWSVASSRV